MRVLGAGPHGREIAALFPGAELFDDAVFGYPPIPARPGVAVIGAAWPSVRRAIFEKYRPQGSGVVVFPGAQVSPAARLGFHVHVGYNAVVAHGCTVGDFVNVCPGATLAGDVTVEDDVFIGAGAVVIHGGITIGRGAVIGAGAVVIANVPPQATVVGVPARVL